MSSPPDSNKPDPTPWASLPEYAWPSSALSIRERHNECDEEALPAKRARKEPLTGESLRLTAESQPQSLFFRLPRELRDMIYEEAFKDRRIVLQHREYDFMITNSRYAPSEYLSMRFQDKDKGLSRWMQSCKSICLESMEMFRKISVCSPCEGGRFRYGCLSNQLVLDLGAPRNLKYRQNAEIFGGLTDYLVILNFIKSLKRLNMENMCLETYWEFNRYPSLKNSSDCDIFKNPWESFENGKFRKVHINLSLVVYTQTGAPQVFLDSARDLAKRLVGPLGQVSKAELKFLSQLGRILTWNGEVLVERKV